MEPLLVVGIVGGAVVAVLLLVSFAKKREARAHKQRLFGEARAFVQAIDRKALPVVSSAIILKPGESAFYSAPAALYETRAVRSYESGSVGFRIAKGITIGRSKGRSVSTQEWTQIDEGVLTVTSKRLVFDGGKADRTVALGKVVSVDASMQTVEVSVEGRQKSMVFGASNPFVLDLIIRICCQVTNPLDLSETELDIKYVE